MCDGCGQPRHESFAEGRDEAYHTEVLVCHACADRERKAWNRQQAREAGTAPAFGERYVVMEAEDERG